MTFKSTVLADLTTIILNTDEFAETVIYKTATAQKSINAIIFRNELQPFDINGGRSLTKTCRVVIAQGASGVDTVVKGTDKISFPEYEGGTAIDWRIVDIIDADGQAFNLLVRK